MVNPGNGTDKVIGQLPLALSGAAAGVLDGVIYIAGGVTGATRPHAVDDVFAFAVARTSFLRAGSLPVAVANAGTAVSKGRLFLVGGETNGGTLTSDVQMVTPNRAFGVAGTPGAGSPYYGDELLVADRGNDRLLLLDDTRKAIWTYPSKTAPPPPGRVLLPRRCLFYPPWHGDPVEPGRQRHTGRDRLPFGANQCSLTATPGARVGARLPQHPR